eukprot:TRINITY_DN10970_c0_g1_i1.p1 TRINITY_DN10970_c0_g1~~TRINITY_DN10970_c0_g1_i1.p1  ORF type:complete len:484 (-),score=51.55 TRINITY_DN10970_c0_g1_i1:177-1598(-)
MRRRVGSLPRSLSNPTVTHAEEERQQDAVSPALRRRVQSSNLFRITDETPRQVLFGLCLLLTLIAIAVHGQDEESSEAVGASSGSSFRKVSLSLLCFMMVYCLLQTRDGVMQRPHPAIWRLLHGWNLWYCTIVTSLLVVAPHDGVVIVQWLFPGVERQQQKSSPETLGLDHLACEITFATFKRQLFSIWFFAHCVGWWAKMVMLRDLKTCLVYSTVFELTELTLQFLVPEFQECWWDSVIMDWLIANTLVGMLLGKLTLRVLNVSDFDWAPDQKWMAQCWKMLTPSSWSEYSWNPANDPVTMLLNAAIWIIMAVCEVNSFFLINLLHLPRNHLFNIVRQVLLCLCAVPAVEEWYEYTRHSRASYLGREWFEYTNQYKGRKPRIGQSVWLLSITVTLETAAIIKYSLALGQWNTVSPGPEIWAPWATSMLIFSIYFLLHCWFFYHECRQCPVWLRVLKYAASIPLLCLCRLYAF